MVGIECRIGSGGTPHFEALVQAATHALPTPFNNVDSSELHPGLMTLHCGNALETLRFSRLAARLNLDSSLHTQFGGTL